MIATIECFITTKDQSLHPLISQALCVFVRSHYTTISENEEIEMIDLSYISDLNSELIMKLLMGKTVMDLSKAELIVALYVKKLFVNDVVVHMNESLNLDLILASLNDLKLIYNSKELDDGDDNDILINDQLEFTFVFYHYTDTIITSNATVIDDFDNITLNSSIPEDYLKDAFYGSSDDVKDFFKSTIDLTVLPNSQFDKTWNDLKLDHSFKMTIFKQLKSSITHNNNNNKLFIIHGPPGSGKSTLCKALCQKLSIYNQFSFNNSSTLLLQISCEKVFSKWYGESSQNLINLFNIIKNLIIKNSNCLIVLIIDEIETLANSRNQILNKNETSDGIRVVNTLLTQLDSLKTHPNFLILSTSNLINSIDEAFLDRADGCFELNRPHSKIIKQIFQNELLKLIKSKMLVNDYEDDQSKVDEVLIKISEICHNLRLSGRSTAKIPTNCLAEFTTTHIKFGSEPIKMSSYLQVLANNIISRALSSSTK